jgi:hypothetical protein
VNYFFYGLGLVMIAANIWGVATFSALAIGASIFVAVFLEIVVGILKVLND